MLTPRMLTFLLAAGCVLLAEVAAAETPTPENQMLNLDLRSRVENQPGSGEWNAAFRTEQWDPRKTAAVVCDMWDQHWCKAATARVAELAPRMNQLIAELRRRGVLIIHAPSDTLKFYKDHPGRLLAQSAPKIETHPPLAGWVALQPAREGRLPIDDSDGGCPCEPKCAQGNPWRRQIETLEIQDGDAITDSAEAFYLMKQRGITHVLVMGVHLNMCVLGRPFSIRQMVLQGQHVALVRDMTDTMYNPGRKPWVDHFSGTDFVIWHIEEHWCPSITSDQIIGGQAFRFAADKRQLAPDYKLATLPLQDSHWTAVQGYVEHEPVPEYQQAPEAAREAFRDMKYGVRIHWGLYSVWSQPGESWPYLKMSNEKKMEYMALAQTFNPSDFDAGKWMDLFQRVGLKCFAFTSKHHEGFSMFDTQTRVARRINYTAPGGPKIEDCDLAFSIMEGPFKRDIVKELCDAAHARGIKIDLYFSHPDWYDADFRPFAGHPLTSRVDKQKEPAQWQHFVQRHRQQLVELLSNYGKLDMICLDMWFDETAWPELRETMKLLRAIQPGVMFRARGVGNYGDYYTPEGFVPGSKANTDMPWMVIYPLGRSFSYEPEAKNHKGGPWIVQNLVDTVAKGGDFMVGIGPDAKGNWHPAAVENLEYAGAWLRTNGEAIYATRPRPGDYWREGDHVRFTRAKDNKYVYAISLKWPGRTLELRTVRPKEGSQIFL
ncbi:MAG: alpha-L-fucosidase, partial [Planctomycetota bacterium]